jgi:hypothetical protein
MGAGHPRSLPAERLPKPGHQSAHKLGPCISDPHSRHQAQCLPRRGDVPEAASNNGSPDRCAVCSANGMPHTYAESLPLGTPGHAAMRYIEHLQWLSEEKRRPARRDEESPSRTAQASLFPGWPPGPPASRAEAPLTQWVGGRTMRPTPKAVRGA